MRPFGIRTLSRAVALAAVLVIAARGGRAAETLTPEKAVALAVAGHPMLRAADDEVGAAEADARLAKSGYLPRLDLTEDYMRSTNPVFVFASKLGEERFGNADFGIDALNRPEALTNAATRLVLRQNVWDGGRTMLGGRAAALGIEASTDSRARTRDEVAFGALRSFWDAVLADEMLEVSLAAEEAAKANVDLARRQEEAGLAVPSDRMSAEVRLAEVVAMRVRAQQGVKVSRAGLRRALGLKTDVEFVLDAPKVRPAEEEGDVDARVAEAISNRPDLLSIDAKLRQAGIGEKVARSHRLPDIGIGAQYEWNARNFPGADGQNWSVGATVRVPIFDGLETSARMARARADRERLEAYRDAAVEGVRLEVRSAWADMVSAAERLRVAESALGQSDEALRIVRERYSEGMAVIVELLGAEAASTAAKGSRAASARDQALAAAALDLATGRDLSRPASR